MKIEIVAEQHAGSIEIQISNIPDPVSFAQALEHINSVLPAVKLAIQAEVGIAELSDGDFEARMTSIRVAGMMFQIAAHELEKKARMFCATVTGEADVRNFGLDDLAEL